VPDPEAGEVPRGYVVPRDGRKPDPETLTAFVEGRVAAYKTIRQWEIVMAIPRTPSGKILRRVLKQQALEPSVAQP
jgi:long-chain acyl-CoA synthetase